MSQGLHQQSTAPANDAEKSLPRRADTSPLLTVDQVAKRLGTPTRFVRRLVAQRRIGFCRVGRYIRIGATDLAEFIEAGRVDPSSVDTFRRRANSKLEETIPPV